VTWRQFAPREQKALKIQRILVDFVGEERLVRLRCLDIGCGNGEISRLLADLFSEIIGLDHDFDMVRQGQQGGSEVAFLQADGIQLPFADATFDIAICAQVYEHFLHAERLPAEVERILKPGGLCFFSGPNKVWPIEPHYKLPFLHWFPARVATSCLRASGRGEVFDIHPYTVWRLRRLWGQFSLHDYTVSMLREPERFGLSDPKLRLLDRAPVCLIKTIYFLLPNYNWILVKPDEQDCH
jgi:SAM-dependent methyltransferase